MKFATITVHATTTQILWDAEQLAYTIADANRWSVL